MEKNDKFNKTTCQIVQVAYELIQQKNTKNITIVDICRAANINRSTFYSHFDNIEDVLSLIDFNMIELGPSIVKNNTSVDYNHALAFLTRIYEKKEFFKWYYNLGCKLNFSIVFNGFYINCQEPQKSLIVEFWNATANSFVENWVVNNPNMTPDVVAKGFIKNLLPIIRKFKNKEVTNE